MVWIYFFFPERARTIKKNFRNIGKKKSAKYKIENGFLQSKKNAIEERTKNWEMEVCERESVTIRKITFVKRKWRLHITSTIKIIWTVLLSSF